MDGGSACSDALSLVCQGKSCHIYNNVSLQLVDKGSGCSDALSEAYRGKNCSARFLMILQLVYGGSGYSDASDTLSDVWVLNPQQKCWTPLKVAGTAPPGREMHSATMVSATSMLVFGGRAGDGRWVRGSVGGLQSK